MGAYCMKETRCRSGSLHRSMTLQGELCCVGLLEKDFKDEVSVVWSYPNVDDAEAHMVTSRSCLKDSKPGDKKSFRYSQFNGRWHYILTVMSENTSLLFNQVNGSA